MGLVLVTSATALEEELVTLRPMEVGGGVTDRAVMPGLKTDKAMSLRGTVLEEDATTERFGRGNMPQLLDEGVLTVGVGAGVEGRNAVLKAKPMIIDIRANLTKKRFRNDDHSCIGKKNYKVTALTDLTCSVIGFNVTFLVSRPMSWRTP